MNRQLTRRIFPLLVVLLLAFACGGQETESEVAEVPSPSPTTLATAPFATASPVRKAATSEPASAPSASPTATPAAPALTPTPTPSQPGPESVVFFEIREVGLGVNGFVSLTNFTGVPASLAGLFLCQGSECFELPDRVVGPQETVRVAVGNGSGIDNVVASNATLGELRPSDGEIAMYSSLRTDEPGEIREYLQWGSTPHDLTGVAVEAGIWQTTGYAPSSRNATRLWRVAETGLWLFEE